MASIGKILGTIFRSSKNINQSAANKIVKKVSNNVPKTKMYSDTQGTFFRMEREFQLSDGSKKLFRVDTEHLHNGSTKTTTKVFAGKPDGGYYFGVGDEGLLAYREKVVTRDPNGGIFGGSKISIDKNYHETMSMTEHYENLTKEYNKAQSLEHKDLTRKYRHWDAEQHATQDKVFVNQPLTSSAKDMYAINPSKHTNYKHALDNQNNYHHFPSKSTNYEKMIEAQKRAEMELKQKAEEAKKAAELAAQKANAE